MIAASGNLLFLEFVRDRHDQQRAARVPAHIKPPQEQVPVLRGKFEQQTGALFAGEGLLEVLFLFPEIKISSSPAPVKKQQ